MNAFLESLGAGGRQADHVITMTDVPHYFALRGFDVPVGSAGTLTAHAAREG